MKNLQPRKKSLGNYIKLGYEISEKTLNKNNLELINKISLVDEYILIIDDILDKSLIRNGKPCLYIERGIKEAKRIAEDYKQQSFIALNKIMVELMTSPKNQEKVLSRWDNFLKNISLGESINKKLEKINLPLEEIEKIYFKMIKLFTGEHIQVGLEIGQLICNKQMDKKVSKAAILIGEIRQIYDDFEDYLPRHHEPFGDFKSQNNRLPEILFKRFGRERKEVLILLEQNRFDEARDEILNEKVRNELYFYCERRFTEIRRINPKINYEEMVEDFHRIKRGDKK